MIPLNSFLRRLGGLRKKYRGWSAICPAHDDKNPSLDIDEGRDGRILVHCWAGCSAEAIARAVNLSLSDLCPDEGRVSKKEFISQKEMEHAEWVVAVAKADIVKKKPLREKDKKEFIRAKEILRRGNEMV